MRGDAVRASRFRRNAGFTDAQNDGHPTGDRFESGRIKTTDDLAHVLATGGLRPIDHHE